MTDFEAYWDLKDFLELLNHGKDLGSKYFFLIRDFGIFFYVRDTDFKGICCPAKEARIQPLSIKLISSKFLT